MSEGQYDDNNKGACWPIAKTYSVQAEIDGRKFYGVFHPSGAKSESAPSSKLWLESAVDRSEIYCVAIFKATKPGAKIAGGELRMKTGLSFWVSLFKNKSEHAQSPTIDLSFQAKEAPAQSQGESVGEDAANAALQEAADDDVL